MERKLVLIEWLDSKGSNTLWEHMDEIEPMPPDRVTSVGFIWEETEEYKTIVHNIGRTQVLGRTTIPCCAIQRLVALDAESISSASLSPSCPLSE